MKKKYKRNKTEFNENEIIKVTSGDRKVMMEAMLETRPKSPRLNIISIILNEVSYAFSEKEVGCVGW